MALSLRLRRKASRGAHTPELLPVWVVAPLSLLVVGAISLILYQYVQELMAHQPNGPRQPAAGTGVRDVIETTMTVLTLIGAVFAGVYAYRRQLIAEADAHRADAGQLADRYTTAALQLGHDQAAVRLAGVYALARLADDWEEQRQVCIDVLCAYLRMPYQPEPGHAGHKKGERQVRHTIIRIIRDHLQDPDLPSSWSACDFDLTGATFDGGDLGGSHFHGTVDFTGAMFSDGTLSLSRTTFRGTARFTAATLGGGTLDLTEATLCGSTLDFSRSTLNGGTVSFRRATLDTGTVSFSGATLNAGNISFSNMTLHSGTVSFAGAILHSGTVSFAGMTLNGGTVSFSRATVNDGTVSFGDATLDAGTVHFGDVTLSGGILEFTGATLGGSEIYFKRARLSGGTLDYSSATLVAGVAAPFFDNATFGGSQLVWGHLPHPPGA